MKTIVVGLCVFGIGCSGQALKSPTSPTSAAISSAATSLTSHAVPFRGSLTATEVDVVTFPTLAADGAADGITLMYVFGAIAPWIVVFQTR